METSPTVGVVLVDAHAVVRAGLRLLVASEPDIDGMAISQALFVGADSFVHKNTEPVRFLDAIRRTAAGQVVMEGLPRGTFGDLAETLDRQRAAEHILTHREREVLFVAAEGLTARQIGRRLGVQERTVTTHLARIYRKLGANSRIGAIAAATRSGVLGSTIGMGPAVSEGMPIAKLVS